ncbi:hypothetical protein ABGB18_07695 [Nonomuraea sp. B12E4]
MSGPILATNGAGHGGTGWGTVVRRQTDWLAFVMRELGLTPVTEQ